MAEHLMSELQVPSVGDLLIFKDKEAKNDLSTALATLTGNPLNFSTRSAQKANQTVISLAPIQDLHGYDHPWPAGGGKSKVDLSTAHPARCTIDKSGDTYTFTATGSYYPRAMANLSALKNIGDLYVSFEIGGTSTRKTVRIEESPNGTTIQTITWYNDTSVSHIKLNDISNCTQPTLTIYIDNTEGGVVGSTLTLTNFIISTGANDDYEPYANYCPIDGRTETSLVGCGKNLIDVESLEEGSINADGEEVSTVGFVRTGFIKISKNDTCNYSGVATRTGSVRRIHLFDENKNWIEQVGQVVMNRTGSFNKSVNTNENTAYIRLSFPNTDTDVQLELGSQATAYESFIQSNNLTIQFGEKVYGATFTMETGELVVDRKKISIPKKWYVNTISDKYWILTTSATAISDAVNVSNEDTEVRIICDILSGKSAKDLIVSSGSAVDVNPNCIAVISNTRLYVIVEKSVYLTIEDFTNMLTDNDVQICYELATPRTIQLTPNEISLLLGVNNISTDGDSITLTYRDGKVATLGDLDSLNVALNDALQDTKTDLSDDITTAQNTANTALAYAQNKVYGMRIRESVESNPASIISYLADAVGMTPVHMDYTNNVFDYGSWEDVWFIKDCKPCILGQDGVVQAYLNKNDYTKDIYGNTVTIDENLTDANVMIEFPKIWYKIVPVVPTCCDADVFISPVKLDDDYKDFAYIAQDKTHKEHFYMPAYNGSIINDGTNDVLRSLSGQAVCNSKTGTVEIKMAQRNGNGWYTETFSQVTLINLLLMLIGKSTDTQTVFGRGIYTGSQTAFNAYRTGAGNTKGMFWGSNDGTQLVKVFGIENWWALQWRRFGGLIYADGTFKYKMCWGQEDGSTTDNYNIDASGYIESPSPTPSGTSGGYISRMFFTTVNMLMSVISGSSSTKYCDGGWFNNSDTRYAIRGGDSNAGAFCGAFAFSLSVAVSSAYWDRGAALSYT